MCQENLQLFGSAGANDNKNVDIVFIIFISHSKEEVPLHPHYQWKISVILYYM
jgi:hypothetical protein